MKWEKTDRGRLLCRLKAARWRAKPGNAEKHREAVRRCRLRPHSKEAHRLRQLSYAAKHREQENERARKWRLENPDKYRAGRRKYYLENSDQVRAAAKEYRKRNPEKYREFQREYQARKRAGGGGLSKGKRTRLLEDQDWACIACGGDLRELGWHLDHIVALANGGRHVDNNVQMLCPTCNRRKSAKDFGEFLKELSIEK